MISHTKFQLCIFSETPEAFNEPMTCDDFEKLGYKKFAKRTDEKVKWAVNRYTAWWEQRTTSKTTTCDRRIRHSRLQYCDELKREYVCYALKRFLTEVRKKNNEGDYPGKTLYELIIMLQFQLEGKGYNWKLLDDPEFITLRHTLDNIMKERAARGLGVRNPSLPATLQIQNRLWEMGILGDSTPDQLRDTLQWLCGFHFALRGGVELRSLRFDTLDRESQLRVVLDEEGTVCLRYREDPQNKTDQGGLNKKPHVPKVVYAYGHPDPDRNIVKLYKRYVSLCPNTMSTDAFWRQSCRGKRLTSTRWYTTRPVGVNTLSTTVKTLMQKSGIPGKWTNHSLRAGCATTLHRHNVDEQVIKHVTGHRSDAVRDYKRKDPRVMKNAERILSGGQDTEAPNVRVPPTEADQHVETPVVARQRKGRNPFGEIMQSADYVPMPESHVDLPLSILPHFDSALGCAAPCPPSLSKRVPTATQSAPDHVAGPSVPACSEPLPNANDSALDHVSETTQAARSDHVQNTIDTGNVNNNPPWITHMLRTGWKPYVHNSQLTFSQQVDVSGEKMTKRKESDKDKMPPPCVRIDERVPNPVINKWSASDKLENDGLIVYETVSVNDYKKRKVTTPERVSNAASQAPGRLDSDSFSCQSDTSVQCHTEKCLEKKAKCRNNHFHDRCCTFLCGFSEFMNGGQTSVNPNLKKIVLSLDFHKGRKSHKSKRHSKSRRHRSHKESSKDRNKGDSSNK